MKNYLAILLSVLISMVASVASAYDFKVDGICYNITSSNTPLTVEVTTNYGSRYTGSVIIPETVTYQYRTYSVTSIGSSAFSYCYSLTSIDIPDGVTSIGECAFMECFDLTSINIPEGVTSIGESAFYRCCNLTSIDIPDGVIGIGKSTFSGCTSLTSINIPEGVTSIGESAFRDCSCLTSIDIPGGVTSIGNYAFWNCSRLTSVIIPDGVTSIGGYAFYGCSNLASINIPDGVTSIGVSMFSGCSSLTAITIPNSVTTIGTSAFYNTRLNSVTIGAGVLSIGEKSFDFRSSSTGSKPLKVIWLTNTPPSDYINAEGIINYVANDLYTSLNNKIVYPFLSSIFDVEGIKYVPVSPSERTCDAIDCCYDTSAVNIHIGKTTSYKGIELQVKNVRPYICYQNSDIKDVLLDFEGDVPEYAFYGCKNLMSATISNRGNVDESAFANASLNGMLTITNDGNIKKSAFSGINGSFQANVNNTGNIAENAFKGTAGMTSLTVNDKVTDLGEQSFYGCTGLSTAAISNQGNIGKSAFAGSKINETLTINNAGNIETSAFSEISGSFTANVNNTGSIAKSAFSKSTGITSLTVSNKVKELGDNSFYGCTGLTTVTISNQGNIGESAFKSSKINGTLTINNLGDIKSSAFRDVAGSFTANINNTGSIGTSTFEGASGITALEIGNNVINLDDNAFKSCSELQTAVLGNNIVSIGKSAFDGCSSLQRINIPNKTRNLGAYAFQNCSQMISAKIGSGITAILAHSFSGCSSMTDVQIGSNVQSISESTFSGCSSLPTITIPEAVNSIGDYTFGGCNALKNIIMEEKNSELTLGCNGKNPMFVDCPLDSVFIGRNISYPTESNQGYSPFYRNTSLRSIHISDVETEVSPNEFYGCTNLKNVRLGDGITDIGNWAFSGCSSIDFFSFGSNLKNIGKEAFSDCTAMTKLISHTSIPPVCGEQALDDINKWNCVLEVPYGSLSAYQSKAQWKEFFFVNEADYCNVTAMSYTREYGDANPSFDFTVEGDIIDGQPEIICEATATSPVGEYPIIIKKGSIKNFNGTLVNGVLTIIKATLSVSVGNYTKKQGEENPEFMLNYSGFKNNETKEVLSKQPSVYCEATIASAPGEYDITVSGAEAQNYDINYTDGKLVVTDAEPVKVTAKSYTREYGEANPTFEYTIEGADLDGTPEIICEATATSPAGEYPIIIKKGSVKNYNDTYINGVLTITKAPLVVSVGNYTKKQGDDNPEFTLNYSGFKNNETEAVLKKKPTATTTATESSAPGEYNIVVNGGEAENYTLSYKNGKLTIIQADAVVITAKSYTREYGDANPTFEYTVEGATLEGQPEIICEATATSPVGEYPIIIRKGNVSNYNDTYINGVLTITKAPLTIGVGKYEKKQYDPMPEFVLNYKGFKNNETNEVLTKQPTVNCEANDNSAPGEYEIIVKDAEAENYEIQYVFGKLVVTEFDSNNIIFADANVKAICIANWDTNGDGELSVKEAAAVKSIGNCFKDNKEISSFNEFRYFTKVAEIGFEAFRGCTLTSITIPGNVKTIDVYAFYDCVCLSSIKVEEGNKVYDSRNECNAIIETETNTLITGCKNTFIPNSVTTIGSSAFELCIGLTDIIIPNSVKSIESDAFNGCSSLTSIAIPNSVKSIGVAAFADCSSLTSIIIPSSVTRIDDYTFRGCTSLRTVIIEGRGNNLSE